MAKERAPRKTKRKDSMKRVVDSTNDADLLPTGLSATPAPDSSLKSALIKPIVVPTNSSISDDAVSIRPGPDFGICDDPLINSEESLRELEETINSSDISYEQKMNTIDEFLKKNGDRKESVKGVGFFKCLADGADECVKVLKLGNNAKAAIKSVPFFLLRLLLFPFAQATNCRLSGEGKEGYSGYSNFLRMLNRCDSSVVPDYMSGICFVFNLGVAFFATIVVLLATCFNAVALAFFATYWLCQLTSFFYEMGRYKRLHAGDK